MRIKFNKKDGFIRVYYGARYLILFSPEKYDAIFNRIRYLTSQKSGSTYVFLTMIQEFIMIYSILSV